MNLNSNEGTFAVGAYKEKKFLLIRNLDYFLEIQFCVTVFVLLIENFNQ